MYTKITTASMMLLGLINLACARREVFARCELKKGYGQSGTISGKLLIAHYEGSEIYIVGNINNLEPGSEHYLSVGRSPMSSQFYSCDGATGSFWEPYSSTEAPYNHLRAVIADSNGQMLDYEHRDCHTTMFDSNAIIGRSIALH